MIRLPLQKNDIAIMDIAINLNLTSNQLRGVNAVREYFNVLYPSEICEPNGTTLARGFLFGNAGTNWYKRLHPEPKQAKPNSYSWKFWQRVLDSVLQLSSLMLKEPLGD